jgi:two-component system phosphate regulon sensor histidine kinase PhoR
VDFRVHIDTQAPVLHDANGVAILVLNLLTNAYKYTRADKRITLDVTDGDDVVILAVGDNGVGIPAPEHGRIFDPFYRVESNTGSKASGAGLGLAIVRHMVGAHQGEVFVESPAQQGSRFIIHLPVARQQESA